MCKTRIMSLKKNVSEDSRSGGKKHIAPVVTAGFLGTTGVLHFAKPEHYDAIVPRALPGSARFYTYASGAAELGIAGLLTRPNNPPGGCPRGYCTVYGGVPGECADGVGLAA